MISFLLRKMWKNKWMMLSLLVGNILLVGIVASTPLYTRATMQRILKKDFQNYQINRGSYPATAEMTLTFNNIKASEVDRVYKDTRDRIIVDTIDSLRIPPISVVQRVTLSQWSCKPKEPREERPVLRSLNLVGYDDYQQHIKLLQGRMPSDALVEIPEGYIIECLANETTLLRQDLLLDELLEVYNLETESDLYFIKIVGIYESLREDDLYWTANPNTFTNNVLISEKLAKDKFIEDYTMVFRVISTWIIMLDYNQVNSDDIEYYLRTDSEIKAAFNTNVHIWNYRANFSDIFLNFSQRTNKLTITLWVLQLPIYVLLAFYIFMVSKQILSLEQNDISVLKSRGASRAQLFGLYAMQSVFVSAVSYLAGIPLGMFICRVLGSSNGFLDLVQRVSLEVVVTRDALLYSGAAVLFSMLTMLAPVVRFSRVTIVDYKRSKSGKPKKSLWQRFYLDILCLGVSLYGLYTFNSQRDMMALVVTDVQAVDPLLYVSSSLFIIGFGLLCLRVFPLLVRLVFILGKSLWPPSLYASLLKVIRSAGEEQFIMIFLVFTLAVGIFDAKAARTINLNNDHKIEYSVGADVVLQEYWRNNKPSAVGIAGQAGPPAGPSGPVMYSEPDFERYTRMEETDAVTKVFITSGVVRTQGSTIDKNLRVMGIETDSFGRTLWTRDDLLPIHINYFLNVLSSRSDGVLLSENCREKLGYEVGDVVYFNNMQGVICGFVKYWPAYAPVLTTKSRTGETVQEDAYLLVANLGYIQANTSVEPYQIWMKTNTPTNAFLVDYIEREDIQLISFSDAKGQVTESKSDPILQGTNGILTVGFIVTLLVCFTGFLIYWILSIKSRVLQFGIFRAMGMTMRNILSLLLNEQLFITFTAVAIGAVVGEISSRLYVPLIQISYSASEQVLPLLVVTEGRDYGNLFTIIGLMIALCLIVLGVIISRIKIAQALKLGED